MRPFCRGDEQLKFLALSLWGIEGITGTFIPIAILFFSLSFIFYMGLIAIKNEILNYKEDFTLSVRNENDIQLYIDELKKTMKV